MIERRAGHQPLYIPRPLRRSMGVARAGLGDDAKRPQFGGDEAGAILGKRREGGSRRSATSRSHPTAARCSLLLTVLILEPRRLDRDAVPDEKNGMCVKPFLVSREATQRSGGLPTLIPFR